LLGWGPARPSRSTAVKFRARDRATGVLPSHKVQNSAGLRAPLVVCQAWRGTNGSSMYTCFSRLVWRRRPGALDTVSKRLQYYLGARRFLRLDGPRAGVCFPGYRLSCGFGPRLQNRGLFCWLCMESGGESSGSLTRPPTVAPSPGRSDGGTAGREQSRNHAREAFTKGCSSVPFPFLAPHVRRDGGLVLRPDLLDLRGKRLFRGLEPHDVRSHGSLPVHLRTPPCRTAPRHGRPALRG
jgi:hypothetical protein